MDGAPSFSGEGRAARDDGWATRQILFGFRELPITMAHGELAASLPLHHKDPFDRMLVAQAILEQMVLVTADSRLGEYPVKLL